MSGVQVITRRRFRRLYYIGVGLIIVITITVQSRDVDGAVEVSVTDTGVGIPEHSQETLFTVNSAHQSLGTDGENGTGLGLNLCSEFVHRHNGEIRVESTPGEGSTFTFTLPVWDHL